MTAPTSHGIILRIPGGPPVVRLQRIIAGKEACQSLKPRGLALERVMAGCAAIVIQPSLGPGQPRVFLGRAAEGVRLGHFQPFTLQSWLQIVPVEKLGDDSNSKPSAAIWFLAPPPAQHRASAFLVRLLDEQATRSP